MKTSHYKMPYTLYPLAAEAFATKEKLRIKIDAIYNQNKNSYYQQIKSSKLYYHEATQNGDIPCDSYTKKALGIILAMFNDDQEARKSILSLIREGWPSLYRNIANSSNINLDRIWNRFIKHSTMRTEEIEQFAAITLLLITILDKKVYKNKGYDQFIHLLTKPKGSSSQNNGEDDNLAVEADKAVEKLSKSLELHLGKKIENLLDLQDIPFDVMDEHKNKLNDYIESMVMLFESERMSFTKLLGHIKVDKKDTVEILKLYCTLYKKEDIDRASQFYINCLLIKSLLRAYKDGKELYFCDNNEDLSLEITMKDEELKNMKNKIKKVQKSKKEIGKELERLKKNYKLGLERQVIESRYKIQKLEEQIKNHKENEKELAALREAMFEREANYTYKAIKKTKVPKMYNCVIVGGHENWQRRLKESLPDNFTFLLGDKENFDIGFLEKIHHVFFYVTCKMKHSTYYKIVNYCKKNNIKIHYINNTEVSLVLAEVADKMTREST